MSESKTSIFPEIPESVDNAIKNITNLPTQGIGQTLSDCWFLAFGGISHLAEKRRAKYAHELENFKNELQDSLSTVPEEFRKEPSTQIVLKTLEEAKYCVEEGELRNLFTKLLTSATDTRQDVHPSFAQIIGQMSPNDAKILRIFKTQPEYPICDLHFVVNDKGSFNVISQNIFISGPKTMSLGEKNISISSLIHLGLLDIPWGEHFSSDAYYSGFEDTAIYLNAKAKYLSDKLELQKKIVRLTSLGQSFISCCLPDDTSYVIK